MSTNLRTDLIGPLRGSLLQREAAYWTDRQLLERYPDDLPDHVWVRYEDHYEKFAKYNARTAIHLQDVLKSNLERGDSGK
jgi:hypothetical protein